MNSKYIDEFKEIIQAILDAVVKVCDAITLSVAKLLRGILNLLKTSDSNRRSKPYGQVQYTKTIILPSVHNSTNKYRRKSMQSTHRQHRL